jgi:acetolactate synthase small subunit
MNVTAVNSDRLKQTVDTYGWKVVSTDADFRILEVTGDRQEIDRALIVLEPMGIDDFTRTGIVALEQCKS